MRMLGGLDHCFWLLDPLDPVDPVVPLDSLRI